MPRGRPRKLTEASPLPLNAGGGVASTSSISCGRPVRNRIAVRKFGVALQEDCSDGLLSPVPLEKDESVTSQPGSGFVLIHKSFWNNLCYSLGCSSCEKKCVRMKTEKLSGLACKLIIYCTACGVVLSQVTSSPEEDIDPDPVEQTMEYEVNRRFVKFFISEGKTYDDVVVFSRTLGIPCISKAMFEKYSIELLAEDN